VIQPAQIICDVCRRPKLEANHWFLAREREYPGFSVMPWDDYEARHAPMHLCSEACVVVALGRYMEAV
jgi:hypothetical protein